MILSRLVLNPLSRDVQRCLADSQRLHQIVMSGFGAVDGSAGGGKQRILYRLDAHPADGRLVLLVQSPVEPSWTSLPPGFLLGLDDGLANPAVKSMGDLLAVLCERMQLAFRLRANATRRIDTKTQADGKRRHGKRVPVRGEEGRLAWLLRQGAANGFELQRTENGQYDIVTREEPRSIGVRQGKRITFSGVRYDGTLTITDALRFRGAVEAGIGPGKAYGFGLLSLKRL